MYKDTYEENRKEQKRKVKAVKTISAIGVVAVIGIAGISSCVSKVDAGYVGVVYTPSTGVQEETKSQGWHFISPLKKVTQFSVATEQLYMSADKREGSASDDSFDSRTRDGKVNVDFEMSYSFDSEKIPEIFTKYRGMNGENIVNTIVRGKIKTYVNEVTSRFTVLEVHLEKKSDVNAEILSYLKDKLHEYGIIVESANLMNTRVDPTIEEAIVERGKANQELEAEKQKTLKAEEEAKRLKVEAEGRAEVKRIEAEAQAIANEQIEQTLTPEMIQKLWIEKWNGSLPTISGSSEGMNIITGLGQ